MTAESTDKSKIAPIREVEVTRYVTPLREGGSLPAIVEADDLGTYVLKFRGAGQGTKVLIAELLAGEIGRKLGLPIPELVFANLDAAIGRNEGDPEIQELIERSEGLNLGMDFLPGSFGFDALQAQEFGARLASEIVWFDAFMTNVDRTARNTNMLIWHRELWLIDNGASIYPQYSGPTFPSRAQTTFPQIRTHVLLPIASEIEAADERLSKRITAGDLRDLVETIPEGWLGGTAYENSEAERAAYIEYLTNRLEGPRAFVKEAIDARAQLV
ncbi:MAG: HipA family kinase [Nitrolancea sp.]